MKITRQGIISAALSLADKNGLSGVSLKSVADYLNIKTPSLYNHIESLEELLFSAASYGMKEMNGLLKECAVGISGEQAVLAAARQYLSYLIMHPGIYETIQWAFWQNNQEIQQHFKDYRQLLQKLIVSCGFNSVQAEENTDIISGFLHGFCTQQLGNAISSPEKVFPKLELAVKAMLKGLEMQAVTCKY